MAVKNREAECALEGGAVFKDGLVVNVWHELSVRLCIGFVCCSEAERKKKGQKKAKEKTRQETRKEGKHLGQEPQEEGIRLLIENLTKGTTQAL